MSDKTSKKQAGNANYSQGLVYLIASAFLLYGNLSKDGAKYMAKFIGDAVYSFYSNSSLPTIPVSKALNLEGKVADCADNIVRISSMDGIGNGVITDPYTIHTAYHIIEYAHKNNKQAQATYNKVLNQLKRHRFMRGSTDQKPQGP